MTWSITGTIGLALALAFAIPVGLLGLDLVTGGRTALGGVFLVLAVLMVLLQQRLTTPGDLPGILARRVAGRVVAAPEGDMDVTEGPGGTGSESESEERA